MAATLTFYPRQALIEATGGGQSFSVPTYGADKGGGDAFHAHAGTSLYVGTRSSGLHVHGWPPCDRKNCIIVLRQWDDVLRAIAGEKQLSFSIAT